jgi:zinc transporter 1/2/3
LSMPDSLNLRISAIFIMIVASSVGVAIPFLVQRKSDGMGESALFKCLKACAAGVMLGIALMHLLPESEEDLEVVADDYSMAFAFAGIGIVLTLTLEQAAVILLSSMETNNESGSAKWTHTGASSSGNGGQVEMHAHHAHHTGGAQEVEVDEHGEHCGFVKCEHIKGSDDALRYSETGPVVKDAEAVEESAAQETEHTHTHTHEKDESDGYSHIHATHAHEEQEMVQRLLSAKTMQQTVALYAMEVSIGVHSLIIGLDIGLLSGSEPGTMATLISLTVAIAFHQFIEGIGLGTVLCGSATMRAVPRHGADAGPAYTKLALFVFIFCSTTPIGILAGILSSAEEETPGQVGIRGTANAVCAGSLLYIGLAEMAAHYFADASLNKRPALKVAMLALFSAGMGAMALLAYWA